MIRLISLIALCAMVSGCGVDGEPSAPEPRAQGLGLQGSGDTLLS